MRSLGAAPPIQRVMVRGLVKTFGSTVALRGVNATIEAARLTRIEGANGSGKSTLLGIVGTVIRPTSGAVTYEPFGDDREMARASIGWLSHESLAYPDLTGRQNIELAARMHGLPTQDAWQEAEERFELGKFALRPLRTCSRGQRQRLALARALVHHPSLILLDEPTTGLDAASVSRLLLLIQAEVDRGAAVVVVSHEPDLFGASDAARLVLDRGRIVPQA
ncbi:ABC transporter ATP-binding protein [Chondromyces crocatus]|uniref:Heme ABC exporter ATP-binding protein CcmA n=1 Tax=Chondromyces crocatus TaxID=52 RepID=A0A0K1E6C1_CHOCO|nr:ABC transporter ATP-binding protein [Chondromyces crocatus]AKT36425.1 heme ABC exporter ATP-binding protein CcmA [Chondromyces crocatus]